MRNIPIANMRGQGFYNGNNIKGEKNGLQSTFSVSFEPYSAHLLNFTINDVSKMNSDKVFFPVVNGIYIRVCFFIYLIGDKLMGAKLSDDEEEC